MGVLSFSNALGGIQKQLRSFYRVFPAKSALLFLEKPLKEAIAFLCDLNPYQQQPFSNLLQVVLLKSKPA